MPLSIKNQVEIVKVMGPYGAGTTDRKSNGVDCRHKDTVLFIADIGTITAGGSVKMTLQGADEDVDGSYVTLEDADGNACEKTLLDGDDDKLLVLELIRPIHRYNRYVLDIMDQNVVINSGIALLGIHGRSEPYSRHETVSHYGFETYISPVESA